MARLSTHLGTFSRSNRTLDWPLNWCQVVARIDFITSIKGTPVVERAINKKNTKCLTNFQFQTHGTARMINFPTGKRNTILIINFYYTQRRIPTVKYSGKSSFEIRIPNFCYIQVIVFDLNFLSVAAVGT